MGKVQKSRRSRGIKIEQRTIREIVGAEDLDKVRVTLNPDVSGVLPNGSQKGIHRVSVVFHSQDTALPVYLDGMAAMSVLSFAAFQHLKGLGLPMEMVRDIMTAELDRLVEDEDGSIKEWYAEQRESILEKTTEAEEASE